MTIGQARSRLLKIWLWSIVPVAFAFVQAVKGKYGTAWPDIFEGAAFVFNLIGPQIGIVLGATSAFKRNSARARAECDDGLFWWCYGMSIVLIFAVTAIPMSEPYWRLHMKELLAFSNVFLQLYAWILSGLLVSFFIAG